MPPAPLTAALLIGATSAVGVIHVALDPEPFDGGRALLIGGGMSVLALATMAGILLARGRWGRWSCLGVGAGWMLLSARDELDPIAILTLAMAASLVTIALGPWLPRWLRHRPSTEGPPPSAVALLVSLLALPTILGVSSTSPAGPAEWSVSLWALGLAFGIARAWTVWLWLGRLLHAPALGWAVWSAGLPGGPWIAALGTAQLALLWRRDLHLAISPLLPERSATTPFPPELVDPAVLRSAGLDPRGNPLGGE